jgi:hypothetical protein
MVEGVARPQPSNQVPLMGAPDVMTAIWARICQIGFRIAAS